MIGFYFNGDPASPSACGVAERCQRAIEDIPRFLRPLERPQGVPRVFPVSMELQELSPALLQPQVTMVAILGELLGTLPRRDKMKLMSAVDLYWGLMKFTKDLWLNLYCTDDTWWHCNVTSNGDDPPASLSWALAAYKSNPWTIWDNVTVAASKWQRLVAALVNSWARLARTATKLHNTCIEAAAEAVDRAATATAWARDEQSRAATYGIAQENMEELGQALDGEEGAEEEHTYKAQKRREARAAASEATRATMERQRVEAALGLLERLVAACDEATAFPRELQRRVGDIEAALKWTNEGSPNVPEDLVAKVAVAEWLWEANARLAKDHLLRTIQDIIKFLCTGGRPSPSACEVAKRCQRAIEDIPRLLRPPGSPWSIPELSPMSMELQELFPALLQPQITVVATVGELLATLPRWDEEMMMLLESPRCLYSDLVDITESSYFLNSTHAAWYHHNNPSEEEPPTSLSQTLAAYRSTPWTTWLHVRMAARDWQEQVDCLVDSWDELATKATELCNTFRVTVTEVTDMVAAATARARELQDEAAHYWTAQENMGELGQALGREEGAEVVAGHGARVRREAMVAASEATRATMVRERVETALGLLERLVAACDEATVFPRELQRRVGDIKATLKGTNEAFPDVPEDLLTKVAVAERLWEANARLAKNHLEGTLDYIYRFYINGEPISPSACGVAERSQRAIEDIPRLLRPPEHPQGVPKLPSVTMEFQELFPALLQPQVTVVATLGELLPTLPRRDEEMLPVSAVSLYWDLVDFAESLWITLYCIEGTWWHRNITHNDGDPPTSLSQALAAYVNTRWTSWDDVTMAAGKWQWSVDEHVNSWAQLSWKATKLHKNCWEVAIEVANRAATASARARELQDEAAHYGTAQENMVELGLALGREEGAEVVAGHGAQVRREARVAASEATRATMVRERMEAALGLLERLVAACDEATAFPRELQRRVGDIEAALKWTNEGFFDIPEELVAKVAEAEQLWEANARLAKDHLLGAVPDIIKFYFSGGPASPSACGEAEQCQRATEDIPRLLQTPESPQLSPSEHGAPRGVMGGGQRGH
ncbi:uncharacterized protein LOC141725758 [Zonotrichia albicollis]|uniref:uncharacterized protein LOC141725758 n=1 Tax=Zonotrichia albicollis TaxID=44394 RepID=UPI003D80E2B3